VSKGGVALLALASPSPRFEVRFSLPQSQESFIDITDKGFPKRVILSRIRSVFSVKISFWVGSREDVDHFQSKESGFNEGPPKTEVLMKVLIVDPGKSLENSTEYFL
jgi:hypothetical protein